MSKMSKGKETIMNGLIIIDKPKEYTSRDIVNIVGKHFKTKKVGHTGTLDPLATGVLVIAVNEGLKIVNLLSNDTKEYIAEVKLGLLTDTLDITGNILRQSYDYNLEEESLIQVLYSFLGKSRQEVPIYSAVKVKGKKLYEYARNNEEVDLPVKDIEISEIELLDFDKERFSFRVVVSKGTYIRSLIRDIGDKLNILCTMSNLKRTKVGIFNVEEANKLEDLDKKINIISIERALSNFKTVEVDSFIEGKIKNGALLDNVYDEGIVVFINEKKDVIAIYEVYSKDNKKIKPLKVFNS